MNQQQSPITGKSSSLKWLLIILVVIVILGGGYCAYARYGKTSTISTSPLPAVTTKVSSSTSTAVSPSTLASIPADWKTYTNSQYGFSFQYPGDWNISDKMQSRGQTGRLGESLVVSGSNESLEIWANQASFGLEGSKYYYKVILANGKLLVTSKDTDALFQPGGDQDGQVVIDTFDNNKDSYIMAYGYKLSEESLSLDKLNQILSTFQFTK